ncbi:hypothetical protein NPIL_236541 [Nephila pilipes]|uniref:Uncharacterized protein n=1 Tax=Nephila pilipes TaxID=299642 RepID=A0A8X6N7J3_NEPPI|nr:hypothetical protein NPIL_236541 [Nephila pilipes]
MTKSPTLGVLCVVSIVSAHNNRTSSGRLGFTILLGGYKGSVSKGLFSVNEGSSGGVSTGFRRMGSGEVHTVSSGAGRVRRGFSEERGSGTVSPGTGCVSQKQASSPAWRKWLENTLGTPLGIWLLRRDVHHVSEECGPPTTAAVAPCLSHRPGPISNPGYLAGIDAPSGHVQDGIS